MLAVVRGWILVSALLVGAGWVLSALHELNGMGYAITLALGVGAWCLWGRSQPAPNQVSARRQLRRRLRWRAPRLFLLLLVLAVLDGICYPPSPTDAAMYRTPRVWHWLAAGQWHWIHTFDIRMNIANCGFEWLSAPLMLFTHSDRPVCLINLFSFALLPGLVFSLFRQLGVAGRVAWWWMWLLPAGFCYAFQAGTQANDGFAAIYALAAVVFALRSAKTGQASDFWISLLAAALTTGAKQTDIPLLLLWLIAALPAFRVFWSRPVTALAVLGAGLLVSAGPMIGLNLAHDGNWSGVPRHPGRDWDQWRNIELQSPFWGVVGNAFSLPLQQFSPPFFFNYQSWNNLMARFVGTPLGSHFSTFENFGHLNSFPTEISAGLGFALCLLLAISLGWHWCWRRQSPRPATPPFQWRIVSLRLAPWLLLLLFMTKVSAMESARQLAPYYPFLLPAPLGLAGMSVLARQRWWRRLALGSMAATAALLVLSPVRPLWPAQTLLGALAAHFPNSTAVARAQSYYQAPVINHLLRNIFPQTLPENEPVVGYATTVLALEPGLWRPFRRQVERVRPDDSPQYLRLRGLHYVVVEEVYLTLVQTDIEELTRRYDARLMDTITLPHAWNKPTTHIYLIRLNVSPEASPRHA